MSKNLRKYAVDMEGNSFKERTKGMLGSGWEGKTWEDFWRWDLGVLKFYSEWGGPQFVR